MKKIDSITLQKCLHKNSCNKRQKLNNSEHKHIKYLSKILTKHFHFVQKHKNMVHL